MYRSDTPDPTRARLPQPADRLPLGQSGLEVSPLCLGLVNTPDAVLAAFDAGVNFFFFTADMHWPLYEPLRQGLRQLLQRGGGIRERIVVAVVSYVTQLEFCRAPLQEALKEVPGLEEVDVAVMGGSYGADFITRLPALQDLCSGRFCGIKALGVTFHDRPAAVLAVNHGLVDIALIRYNSSHDGARLDVLPHLRRSRSTLLYNFNSTLGYVPPGRLTQLGLSPEAWRPVVTDHYRFVLTRQEFDGILCAPRTPAEVQGLVEALAQGGLQPDEEEHLINLSLLSEGRADEATQRRLQGEQSREEARQALMRRLLREEAARRGVEATDGDLQEAADAFRRRHGLHNSRDAKRWLEQQALTLQDFEQALEDQALMSKLLQTSTTRSSQTAQER